MSVAFSVTSCTVGICRNAKTNFVKVHTDKMTSIKKFVTVNRKQGVIIRESI